MRLCLAIVLLVAACSSCTTGLSRTTAAPSGDERSITVDGRERTYRVRVPEGADGPLPVLFVLHGGGGNGEQVERQTGLTEAAAGAGFIAVYPDGTGRTSLLTWNSGNCCGYARSEDVDDVAFVSAVLDEVLADFPADAARVYATGMSNGGMMSYRLACELSDRIAAVAVVAGALNVACEPREPVSVLAIHGTADQHVRYEGGPTRAGVEQRTDASVADSVGFWTSHDECPAPPQENRDGAVTVTSHGPCSAGTRVTLYSVDGGGHAWPGGERNRPGADPAPPEPDATAVIVDFFEHVPAR
jgi:polyhydroxybutyrate depolymerase